MDIKIGTGGWGYFEVTGEYSLSAYSKAFEFVEVNNTFYHYPAIELVEAWRAQVPENFVFSVKCNRELTHDLKIAPVDRSFEIYEQMQEYCRVLNAELLVLQTPPSLFHIFAISISIYYFTIFFKFGCLVS